MTRPLVPAALAIVLSAAILTAQTRIVPPANKYKPTQDVELGKEAAAQVRKELPLMRDDAVTSYVEDLGRSLVNAIPTGLTHTEFQYTFETVNVRDINAFALPGGPMFVNRGMIEAAATEGEVAGVMAHEISHVVLRHGTAQAGKAKPDQIGSVLGQIAGAVIGGGLGQIVSYGSQFGLGTAFMRFSRDYEKQADLQGAQIMARAGYNPRDMANMFKTIEKTGGGGGPQWLSDHPNPGNRSEYIEQEARALRVENAVTDSSRFDRIKAHLKSLPKAPSSEEVARTRPTGSNPGSSGGSTRPPSGSVAPPSSSFSQYTAGNVFRVSVPSNWRQVQNSSSVTFAPDGAYGEQNGQSVFTHGIEFGFSRAEGHDLQTASDELVDSLAKGNPRMRAAGRFRNATIGGRQGLSTTLQNVSEATGRNEAVQVSTTLLQDGGLFYAIAVAPDDQSDQYTSTFKRVLDSVRFMR